MQLSQSRCSNVSRCYGAKKIAQRIVLSDLSGAPSTRLPALDQTPIFLEHPARQEVSPKLGCSARSPYAISGSWRRLPPWRSTTLPMMASSPSWAPGGVVSATKSWADLQGQSISQRDRWPPQPVHDGLAYCLTINLSESIFRLSTLTSTNQLPFRAFTLAHVLQCIGLSTGCLIQE